MALRLMRSQREGIGTRSSKSPENSAGSAVRSLSRSVGSPAVWLRATTMPRNAAASAPARRRAQAAASASAGSGVGSRAAGPGGEAIKDTAVWLAAGA